jgi:membrane-bound ClpP family serine protease
MGTGMAAAALVIVGILLVVLGIFAGGNLALVGLGVVCLIAGGAYQMMSQRRT